MHVTLPGGQILKIVDTLPGQKNAQATRISSLQRPRKVLRFWQLMLGGIIRFALILQSNHEVFIFQRSADFHSSTESSLSVTVLYNIGGNFVDSQTEIVDSTTIKTHGLRRLRHILSYRLQGFLDPGNV